MSTTKISIPSYVPKPKSESGTPYVVVMSITPEIADFWLKTYNRSNRPLNDSHVIFLTSQMERGQWVEMNGNTISFNNDLQLNDGQHRLAAIVKSGLSFNFVVMVGVSKEAFMVMDTGRKRSGGDVLSIEGYKKYSLLSAAASFVLNWDRGKFAAGAKKGGGKTKNSVTNTDILQFVKDNESIFLSQCDAAKKYYKTGDKLVTESWLAALLHILSRVDAKSAERFIFQLATGTDIKYRTGLYFLRNKLSQAKLSDSKAIPTKTKLAYIVKAWNSHRKGLENVKLRYHPSKGEKFPTII